MLAYPLGTEKDAVDEGGEEEDGLQRGAGECC